MLISKTEVQSFYSLNSVKKMGSAKPFLKWAGGKGQLLQNLIKLFPVDIHTSKIKKYAEPFIGGGALYFYVAQNFPQIKHFFISDINHDLILAYKTIQKDVESLIFELKILEESYRSLGNNAQKDFFYDRRAGFNKKALSINSNNFDNNWIERTADIIFLNKTCFNGLFRVNSKGEFNVPFGDYKNPKICDAENLRLVSNLLQKTEIQFGDFTISEAFIDSSTFVYFDPPYRPLSKTANFTSYSKKDFRDDAQKRLSEFYTLLSNKKAKLMLSNSDPKNNNSKDTFFEELYKNFQIERVDASRMINSNAEKRGKIKELIIMNYSQINGG